ncbi:MAG: ribosomal protein L13e [Promethearchaeota archaeon]
MEQPEQKPIAMVISPARDHHIRKGKGFSLKEIEKAGKSIRLLKELGIPIDFFRRSSHEWNVKILKEIKLPEKKKAKKKKRPWIPKEQRIKKKPKPKVKRKAPTPKKEDPKKAAPKAKATKAKPAKPKTATKTEEDKTPLTRLSGLGQATANKFAELGVNSIEDLLKENPSELAVLIKGCSEERIKRWIEEGKELLNK